MTTCHARRFQLGRPFGRKVRGPTGASAVPPQRYVSIGPAFRPESQLASRAQIGRFHMSHVSIGPAFRPESQEVWKVEVVGQNPKSFNWAGLSAGKSADYALWQGVAKSAVSIGPAFRPESQRRYFARRRES